jgi:hypothetical protein
MTTIDPTATRAALAELGIRVDAFEVEPGRWQLQLWRITEPLDNGRGVRAWGLFTHGDEQTIWERAQAWLERRQEGQGQCS